jgi:hypothetical protein
MSEITRDHPQHQLAEPIQAPAWKNLDFTKDGRSFLQIPLYPSEADARAHCARQNAECDRLQREALQYGSRAEIINEVEQHCFWWDEYSHTIQIPWFKQ